jgi:hypothetical protein
MDNDSFSEVSSIGDNNSVHSFDNIGNLSLDEHNEDAPTVTIPPMAHIQEIRDYLTDLGIPVEGGEGSVTLRDIYNYAYLRGYGDGAMVSDSFASNDNEMSVPPPLTIEDLNVTPNPLNNAIINLNETTDGETDLDMTLSFGNNSNSFGGKKRRRKTKKSLKKRRKTRRK